MLKAAPIIVRPPHLCNPKPKGSEPGTRYGRLVIQSFLGRDNSGDPCVGSMCDCGKLHVGRLPHLRSGKIASCGCLHSEMSAARRFKHGHTKGKRSPEYNAWEHMIERCYDPKWREYFNYGGRGITVCERWKNSFVNFLADMGLRPSANHSIDRIENAGNYEIGNCRWATRLEQNNNKRSNRNLTLGDKTQTLAQWARELGITGCSLSERIQNWPSLSLALTAPKGYRHAPR